MDGCHCCPAHIKRRLLAQTYRLEYTMEHGTVAYARESSKEVQVLKVEAINVYTSALSSSARRTMAGSMRYQAKQLASDSIPEYDQLLLECALHYINRERLIRTSQNVAQMSGRCHKIISISGCSTSHKPACDAQTTQRTRTSLIRQRVDLKRYSLNLLLSNYTSLCMLPSRSGGRIFLSHYGGSKAYPPASKQAPR